MKLSKDDKTRAKKFLLFLVEEKHKQSGGHNGFHPIELLSLMNELEADGKIMIREQMNIQRYFLNTKK